MLAEVREAKSALEVAVAAREAAEQAYAAEQQRLQRLTRAAADRREGLARLQGQVNRLRAKLIENRIDPGEE